MNLVGIIVLIIILAGLYAFWHFWLRHRIGTPETAAFGQSPDIPGARPQGSMPTLKMPTARGWAPGEKPATAEGLAVTEFAGDFDHCRMMHVLPNGDVLVAEAATEADPPVSLFDFAAQRVMRRAGALRKSANRIILLRDADGDGVPELRTTFLDTGLRQPFGMALVGSTLYVGNTDSLVAYPYEEGQTEMTAAPRTLMDMKPGGHWTRNLIASKDGKKLYVAVGSLSNIADAGFEEEEGRACIYEVDLETGEHRTFASGLRNPVGMAFEPETDVLFTVVNERDGLGDETPPDYLTSVGDGAFYGWPYCYWGQTVDDRVPQDPEMVAKAIVPDYALGGHTASLGLCWVPEGTLNGLPAGMAIGQHGSWNRSKLSGYKVILVPFENGKPSGPSRDILTGFLPAHEKFSYGRPVGVQIAKDGALLVADDVGHKIWRVTGA